MSDFWTPMAQVKARKPHRCHTCFRRIDPGEMYGKATGNYDGRWFRFSQCVHCLAIGDLYDPRDDENLISVSAFEWWADSPRDVTELRHVVQWQKQWRRHDGGLFPIPERTGGASAGAPVS